MMIELDPYSNGMMIELTGCDQAATALGLTVILMFLILAYFSFISTLQKYKISH